MQNGSASAASSSRNKDIGVGATLDLTDEPLFIARQGRERIRQGKPVWKKLLGDIGAAPPQRAYRSLLSEILLITFISVSFR
jgi:hypothetical protein